jgi:hypothetical protein
MQLRSSRAEQEERNTLRPVRQVLEEGQEGRVSPVQILETEHCRPPLRKRLQESPPRGIGLLLRRGLGRCTDERREARLEPGPVGIVRRQRAVELGCRLGGRVGLQDAALGLDHLPERPEGDALPVGQAAALAPNDVGTLLDVLKELCAEAALPHPRFTHDRHELARALLGGALIGPEQERLLQLPAD